MADDDKEKAKAKKKEEAAGCGSVILLLVIGYCLFSYGSQGWGSGPVRIDATSETTYQATMTLMVASMSANEREEFQKCLGTFLFKRSLNKTLEDPLGVGYHTLIASENEKEEFARKMLHGLSAKDIIRIAKE